MDETENSKINLSVLTQALIDIYTKKTVTSLPPGTQFLRVSKTVSLAAVIFEKMRNAVEYREEHLIRRAAIERILRRRLLFNPNGQNIAEPLINELLWAKYLADNTIPETKIKIIQQIIDKYIHLRNEVVIGRSNKDQKNISNWILEVLSSEIEENLVPSKARVAFIHFVFQHFKRSIYITDSPNREAHDALIYIAVEKAFAKSDDPLIRYRLFSIFFPKFRNASWEIVASVVPNFYDAYKRIEDDFKDPFNDKLRRHIKRQTASYLILRDIFEEKNINIEKILSEESQLKTEVDKICRKKYQETGAKLRRAGIRSIIYIFLTKMVFAFLLEYPVDLFLSQKLELIPLFINILFPPFLMFLVVIVIGVPGQDNTRRIYEHIKSIISQNPNQIETKIKFTKYEKKKTSFMIFAFSIIYLLAFIFSFGSIVLILTRLNFNLPSQLVFIFFLTIVSFFGYRISQTSREYLVVEKEGVFAPIVDFVMLPILRVGQWLSSEIARFNIFMFIFDFLIEAPFKAIIEVLEEWIRFMRAKKEEMA